MHPNREMKIEGGMTMRGYRPLIIRTIMCLVLASGGFASATRAAASHRSTLLISGPSPIVLKRALPAWTAYDRSAYVVSTLNLPLCPDGGQLTHLLATHYHARGYGVVQSTGDPDVYFIQVWNRGPMPSAVYAYRMGFEYPEGVWSAPCASPAPDTVVRMYRSYALVRVAWFHSTLP